MMKKCGSELELEAFIREDAADDEGKQHGHEADVGVFCPGGLSGLSFGDSDTMDGSNARHMWRSESVCTPHHAISTTIESQTACNSVVASPSPRATTSAKHGPDSGLGSDSESLIDVEGVPCERGTKSMETKRIRRMVSNRESARRSRKRKQAQLSDLESQSNNLKVKMHPSSSNSHRPPSSSPPHSQTTESSNQM